jgi:hypothetical protein
VLLFLCSLPLLLGAFFIVIAPTAFAMAGPWFIRKRFALETLVANNEIAGFKFATVGVIYAVILAFAIVTVWDKFSEAEALVLQEAGAAASLYRISAGEAPEAKETRAALDAYLGAVIDDEWPRMAQERESRDAARALDRLYFSGMRLGEGRSSAIGVEIMKELGAITQARRGRLHLSEGSVPMALWLMLTFGAALTVGFTFFFGLENLVAQIAMTGGLASIVFLGLFVIVSYDHPFTGDVRVQPHPLRAVYDNFHQA